MTCTCAGDTRDARKICKPDVGTMTPCELPWLLWAAPSPAFCSWPAAHRAETTRPVVHSMQQRSAPKPEGGATRPLDRPEQHRGLGDWAAGQDPPASTSAMPIPPAWVAPPEQARVVALVVEPGMPRRQAAG